MAVTTNKKPTPAVGENKAPTQEGVYLELARVQRLMMGGILYEKGKVYVFTPTQATRVLQQKDPQGIPLFTKAKPRTKLVEVPVELTQFPTRTVESDDPLVPSGVRSLDLGDDDPELQARLSALDEAGEAPEFVGGEVRVTV